MTAALAAIVGEFGANEPDLVRGKQRAHGIRQLPTTGPAWRSPYSSCTPVLDRPRPRPVLRMPPQHVRFRPDAGRGSEQHRQPSWRCQSGARTAAPQMAQPMASPTRPRFSHASPPVGGLLSSRHGLSASGRYRPSARAPGPIPRRIAAGAVELDIWSALAARRSRSAAEPCGAISPGPTMWMPATGRFPVGCLLWR
jgi:hypothetical protein